MANKRIICGASKAKSLLSGAQSLVLGVITKSLCRRYLGSFIWGALILLLVGVVVVMGCASQQEQKLYKLPLPDDYDPIKMILDATSAEEPKTEEPITEKPVVPLLIGMLENENEHVRFVSAEALEEITGQDFGEDYDKWLKWLDEQTSNERRYKRCLRILNEPVTLIYKEKSLDDIIGDIAEQNALSFVRRHLSEETPGPITFSCENIPLSQALKELLEPLGLQYTVTEEGIKGVIMIESCEENKDK